MNALSVVPRKIHLIIFWIILHSTHIYVLATNYSKLEVWLSGCKAMDVYTYEAIYFSLSENANSNTNFANECVIKTSAGSFVGTKQAWDVVFTCEANYPIIWKFPVSQDFRTEYYTSSSFNITARLPISKTYRAIVILPCNELNAISATISCASAELTPELSSSFYFSSVDSFFSLLHDSFNRSLETLPNGNTANPLILPCRPLLYNQAVLLDKQNLTESYQEDKAKWKPVKFPTNQIVYNSKIGFILNGSVNAIVGLYRCTSQDSRSKTVHIYFNVTKEIPSQHVFQPKSVISGNASVVQNMSYFLPNSPRLVIKCCSGIKGKPPKLSILGCYSQNNCNSRQNKFLHEFENDLDLPYHSVRNPLKKPDNISDCSETDNRHHAPMNLVACKGENIEYAELWVSVFHKLSDFPVKLRWKQIYKSDNASVSDTWSTHAALLAAYAPMSNIDTLEASEKIFIAVLARQRLPQSDIGFVIRLAFQDLFLENQTNPTNLPFSKTNDTNRHINLEEHNRDVFFEGEALTVLCIGWKMFYAKGAKVRMGWRNGTTTEMQLESFIDRQGLQLVYLENAVLSDNSEVKETVSVLSKEVNASWGLQWIECWMPRVSSSKWDGLIKQVKVLKAGFVEKKEESISFSGKDEENIISCSVAEWHPKANISVSWNDMPISIQWKGKEVNGMEALQNAENQVRFVGTRNAEDQIIRVEIHFYGMQNNQSGIYRCVADNGIITVTRTVHVTVQDKSYFTVILSVAVMGVLILAAVLGIWMHKSNCKAPWEI